jgi:hypothetical protein
LANENIDETEQSVPILNKYIRCPECGEQIEMVPVLGQMIEAIENHLETHRGYSQQKCYVPPKMPSIEEDLTVQVLQRAAEISGTLNRNSIWINTE